MIIAGDYHTFLIDSENNVLACGQNGSGQLGLGNNQILDTFQLVPTDLIPYRSDVTNTLIKSIAVGDEHSVMITSDNKVAMSGSNYVGQLGIDKENLSEFTVVHDKIEAKMVSCGTRTTVILAYNGDIHLTGLGIIKGVGVQPMQLVNCNYLFDTDNLDEADLETGDHRFYGDWIRVCNDQLLVIDTLERLWYCSEQTSPKLIESGIAAVEADIVGDTILIRDSHGNVFPYVIDESEQETDPVAVGVLTMEHSSDRIFALSEGSVVVIDEDSTTDLGLEGVKRLGVSNNSVFAYTDVLLAKGFNYSGQLGLGSEFYSQSVPEFTEVDISGDTLDVSTGVTGVSGVTGIDDYTEIDDYTDVTGFTGIDADSIDDIEEVGA